LLLFVLVVRVSSDKKFS